jgi:hypothetical protein
MSLSDRLDRDGHLESDDLIARARERAEASPIPDEWGYRVALDEGEHFLGRWRGETTDEGNGRRVYLLWDEDGGRCFSRDYTALGREVDRARPETGDRVVIFRGLDYIGQGGNPGYSFGLEKEPFSDPLPDDTEGDDGVPFLCRAGNVTRPAPIAVAGIAPS